MAQSCAHYFSQVNGPILARKADSIWRQSCEACCRAAGSWAVVVAVAVLRLMNPRAEEAAPWRQTTEFRVDLTLL